MDVVVDETLQNAHSWVEASMEGFEALRSHASNGDGSKVRILLSMKGVNEMNQLVDIQMVVRE